jgi:preprotein translocase subunit SecG
MLTFFIVILTIALFLDCLLLGLLILVQLPKKDAGVGMAFGGGAADALFGAGSGNALTKLTKYSAGIFFVLVVLLSVAKGHEPNVGYNSLIQESERLKKEGKMTSPPATDASLVPSTNANASTNAPVQLIGSTNMTIPAATNTATTNPPAAPIK